jgi:hypothetical protein
MTTTKAAYVILCTSSNLHNVGEMVGVDFSRPIVGLKNADFESAHCFVSHNFLSYLLPVFPSIISEIWAVCYYYVFSSCHDIRCLRRSHLVFLVLCHKNHCSLFVFYLRFVEEAFLYELQ